MSDLVFVERLVQDTRAAVQLEYVFRADFDVDFDSGCSNRIGVITDDCGGIVCCRKRLIDGGGSCVLEGRRRNSKG